MTSKINIGGTESEYLSAADLIEVLQEVPGDTLVVLSRDAEGNGYSPFAGTTPPGQYYYEPSSTWSGNIVDPNEKDGDEDYYDEDRQADIKRLTPCLVLWPTN